MKRTLYWSVALLAALCLIIRFGIMEWRAARLREVALLASIAPDPALSLTPSPRPEPARKNESAAIANANLFSPDRNPDVEIPVDPPKPVPPLPIVFGVSSFSSGTKAIMAANPGDGGRTVREGDAVGAFTIVRMDSTEVTFDWDGKEIIRSIADLMNQRNAGANADLRQIVRPQTISANNLSTAAGPGPASPGQTQRPCVAGDDSPIGTVVDGFRKVVVAGSAGPRACYWSLDR